MWSRSNTAGVKIARELADAYSKPDHPRFVVASMGPTGMLPSSEDPDLGKVTPEASRRSFTNKLASC